LSCDTREIVFSLTDGTDDTDISSTSEELQFILITLICLAMQERLIISLTDGTDDTDISSTSEEGNSNRLHRFIILED